jgi:AcrR family transcriptional regulator
MTPSTALPRRRTQEERSTSTRARLLEATVECLHELGFAGTSTTVVSERAGVSRGAQLHHYPSKHELVVAAIDHVLQKRVAEFRAQFAGARVPKAANERVGAAVELLWAITSGPTFYAWLELLVASRTDRKLKKAMKAIAKRFEQSVREVFHELFPALRDTPALDTAPWFTLATLQGFALDRILDPDEPRLPLGLQILTSMGARAMKRVEESR